MKILSSLCAAFGVEAAQTAAAVADAGLEKLFGQRVSEVLAEAEQAVRGYTGPLPLNHDLEGALRCAQLTASLIIVRCHRFELEAEAIADGAQRTARLPAFLDAAQRWLNQQLGICPGFRRVPNDQLVVEMEAALDEMLRSGAPVDQARAKTGQAAQEVWDEVLGAEGLGAPPDDFRVRFFGPRGWATAFRALAQDVIRKKPLVRDAFLLSRLAALRDDSATLRPALDALAGDVSEFRGVIEEVVRTQRATKSDTESIRLTTDRILTDVTDIRNFIREFPSRAELTVTFYVPNEKLTTAAAEIAALAERWSK